jgi:uncharacterized Fe-S cluster-containing protein
LPGLSHEGIKKKSNLMDGMEKGNQPVLSLPAPKECSVRRLLQVLHTVRIHSGAVPRMQVLHEAGEQLAHKRHAGVVALDEAN